MRKTLFLLFCFAFFGTNAQLEEARKRVEILCSDSLHGRGYVSGGDSIAASFLAREYEKIGLKSVKGSYFQSFSFPVNSFPNSMSIKTDNQELKAGLDFIVDPQSPSTKGTFKVVRMEHDVLYKDEVLISKLKSLVGEQVVLISSLQGLSSDSAKYVEEISRELSLIYPVLIETEAKFTWSVGTRQGRNLLAEIRPNLVKSEELEISIDAHFIPNHKASNVIGFVKGKKSCGKKLVFTAHYDHLGRMGSDALFPGANDNASGTAMLLTMADYFVQNKPKYDTYFIAFAGEEAGLIGSQFFVENPLVKLNKIKCVVNLDIMGSGEDGITVVNATENPDIYQALLALNESEKFLPIIKSRGPAANSDHHWFAEADVPAIFIYTMGPNKNYHDINDTYDALSFQAYESITQLLIHFVQQL